MRSRLFAYNFWYFSEEKKYAKFNFCTDANFHPLPAYNQTAMLRTLVTCSDLTCCTIVTILIFCQLVIIIYYVMYIAFK